jgi:hypothetical protein
MATTAVIPDVTIAMSSDAAGRLIRAELDKPLVAQGSGSWGPFVAGYNVNLQVSGGTIQFIDLDSQISLQDVVVQGTVGASVGLNLANVLPHLCFPPVQVCANIPLIGQVCSPQYCVSWPTISVPITIPVPPLGISAVFALSNKLNGNNWEIDLNVFPFSIQIDLTPSINAVIDAVESTLNGVLGNIPLIGGLISSLIDTVLNTLKGVIDSILGAISDFIRNMIYLIDLFSPTIPFHIADLPAVQRLLPAGSAAGDREVDLTISSLSSTILNQELVVTASFA